MRGRPQAPSAVAFDALRKNEKSVLPHFHPPSLTLAQSLGFLTLFLFLMLSLVALFVSSLERSESVGRAASKRHIGGYTACNHSFQ